MTQRIAIPGSAQSRPRDLEDEIDLIRWETDGGALAPHRACRDCADSRTCRPHSDARANAPATV